MIYCVICCTIRWIPFVDNDISSWVATGVAATGDGSNFVRISYWVSRYWRQAIRAPTWSVCYSLVVIYSVSFRFVCCFVCPLERWSRALVSEQDGRAFCVRNWDRRTGQNGHRARRNQQHYALAVTWWGWAYVFATVFVFVFMCDGALCRLVWHVSSYVPINVLNPNRLRSSATVAKTSSRTPVVLKVWLSFTAWDHRGCQT